MVSDHIKQVRRTIECDGFIVSLVSPQVVMTGTTTGTMTMTCLEGWVYPLLRLTQT